MAIHLGRPLPSASRDRPGWRRGSPPEPEGSAIPTWSCSRWGLPCRCRYRRRGALLPHHFTLTTPSLRKAARGLAVCFCGTFPRVAPAGRYPAPCFHGARTFLPRRATKVAIRPSGKAIEARARARVKCRNFLWRPKGQESACAQIEIRRPVSMSSTPSQRSGRKWR
jgi:hypothetical protein